SISITWIGKLPKAPRYSSPQHERTFRGGARRGSRARPNSCRSRPDAGHLRRVDPGRYSAPGRIAYGESIAGIGHQFRWVDAAAPGCLLRKRGRGAFVAE